jgi:hypothetical protein
VINHCFKKKKNLSTIDGAIFPNSALFEPRYPILDDRPKLHKKKMIDQIKKLIFKDQLSNLEGGFLLV